MVDALWQYDEIALLHPNADQAVFLVPHIKIPRAVDAKADLFIVVYVLTIEHLDLVQNVPVQLEVLNELVADRLELNSSILFELASLA